MLILFVCVLGDRFSMDRVPEPGEKMVTEAGVLLVGKKLGGGSFGVVFKAHLVERDLEVALKFEKPSKQINFGRIVPRDYTKLSHEYNIMNMMKKTHGFPNVYAGNFRGKVSYLVMQFVDGKSLSGVKKQFQNRIPTKILVPIAIQILNRLEKLHARGYLQYDIHDGNYMVAGTLVYAIDLGMAFRYVDKRTKQHVPYGGSHLPREMKHSIYCSREDEEGHAVGRRDEIERFLYLMVRLLTRQLPWERYKDNLAEMARVKRTVGVGDICRGPAAFIAPALDHVFGLEFTQKPNYDFIRSVFEKRLN